MSNVSVDIAALEQLPEVDATALGGDEGCLIITCVVSCLVTKSHHDW